MLGGRSRDRRRSKDVELADERPRRKGYRPWRNRAIVYCLIETGMRRAAVCNLDLGEIDFEQKSVTVREKGGQTHRYKISKEGAKAIQDYLREERGADQEMFPHSPALFLPPETVVNSSGRLSPRVTNTVWNEACRWANVKHKTPHTARHAMGRHIMQKGTVAPLVRGPEILVDRADGTQFLDGHHAILVGEVEDFDHPSPVFLAVDNTVVVEVGFLEELAYVFRRGSRRDGKQPGDSKGGDEDRGQSAHARSHDPIPISGPKEGEDGASALGRVNDAPCLSISKRRFVCAIEAKNPFPLGMLVLFRQSELKLP